MCNDAPSPYHILHIIYSHVLPQHRLVEWSDEESYKHEGHDERSIVEGQLTIYDHVVIDCKTTHPSNELEVIQMPRVI